VHISDERSSQYNDRTVIVYLYGKFYYLSSQWLVVAHLLSVAQPDWAHNLLGLIL